MLAGCWPLVLILWHIGKRKKTAERAANENSFANVASQWLEHWQHGKSPRHVDSTRRRLNANILPTLGERPTAEIEAPELVSMVKAIEQRGARDIASRVADLPEYPAGRNRRNCGPSCA